MLGGYTIVGIFTARSGVPFNISDSTNSLNFNFGPYGIPRYTPSTPIKSYSPNQLKLSSANDYTILTLPLANQLDRI